MAQRDYLTDVQSSLGKVYKTVIDEDNGDKPTQSTYDIRRGQTARDLLDANVQTYIADEVARKNTQTQLAGMGLANSGFAGTTSALQGNALQSQLMQNQRNYQDAMQRIAAEEAEDQNTVIASEAASIAERAQGLYGENLTRYLTESGFKQDDNGKWIDPTGRYTDRMMFDVNQIYLANGIAQDIANQNQLAEYGVTSNSPRFNTPEGMVAGLTLANGSKGKEVEYEVYELFDKYATKPDGFVARLVSGNGDDMYTTVMKIGNQWVQIDDNAYDLTPTNNRATIKGASGEALDKAKAAATPQSSATSQQTQQAVIGKVVTDSSRVPIQELQTEYRRRKSEPWKYGDISKRTVNGKEYDYFVTLFGYKYLYDPETGTFYDVTNTKLPESN